MQRDRPGDRYVTGDWHRYQRRQDNPGHENDGHLRDDWHHYGHPNNAYREGPAVRRSDRVTRQDKG